MPTEMELTLEQTQQGVSYEVSVDPHGFEGISKDGDGGLTNAVIDAAANMNKVLANLSPLRLIRIFKEKDEIYSIKYQMPGLSKDDVKIIVKDGMLFI
ncbi:26.5 kDa heat shock protein, mitochondrial-like protein isoform X1 [Tanacetum coccineum]